MASLVGRCIHGMTEILCSTTGWGPRGTCRLAFHTPQVSLRLRHGQQWRRNAASLSLAYGGGRGAHAAHEGQAHPGLRLPRGRGRDGDEGIIETERHQCSDSKSTQDVDVKIVTTIIAENARRTIHKQRSLTRRMSEPSEHLIAWYQSQNRKAVAKQPIEESEQKITEEPAAPPTRPASSADQVTAQPSDELWSCMGGILDVKIGALGSEVAGALASLETKLDNPVHRLGSGPQARDACHEHEDRSGEGEVGFARNARRGDGWECRARAWRREYEGARLHDLAPQAHYVGSMARENTEKHDREGGKGVVNSLNWETRRERCLQSYAPNVGEIASERSRR